MTEAAKTVVVTGAGGFVGRHLAERLAKEGAVCGCFRSA
jgi:nucleoside-diphosphate-sugar epimerase